MGMLGRLIEAVRGPAEAPAWYEREHASAVAIDRYGPTDPVSSRDGWFIRHLGGATTNSSVPVSETISLRLPVVYACVNRITNPFASFPMRIYRRKPEGGSEAVTDHPFARNMGLRPNPFMSSRTTRKTLLGGALLWGNGYQEIERNGRGQAIGLWPLLPDRTRPRKVDDRVVYSTTISGRNHEIDQEDVIHLMDQSLDGYVGLSQIGLAREAVGMGLAMEAFGGKFFANDAKSGGFLMHPGKLSGNAMGNLRGGAGQDRAGPENPAARLERQGGLDNAHRVKVLEEGMKWISTTIPPEDAQFLGSREFQIAEIARMFDVPLILLQSHEKSTSWGTGIEQLMIGFVRQTISPWVEAYEQELNWKLFTDDEIAQGYYVKLHMNAVLRGDMEARSNFYKAMFELGGFSPNRILELEDEEPIGPDGDHHFVTQNVKTLAEAINPPPPRTAPANGAPATPPAPAGGEDENREDDE